MTTSTTCLVPKLTSQSETPAAFQAHPARGRFNAAFFAVMGGQLNWHMRKHKAKAVADFPRHVVELGSGVGANLRYPPAGACLTAIEPNPYMHPRLKRAAL